MAVSYKLREDLRSLIVCLYCPSGSSEESQYTFSSLWNYINDCDYQIKSGEKVKRVPYHVAPCQADAIRAQEDLKRTLAALRKERNNTTLGESTTA